MIYINIFLIISVYRFVCCDTIEERIHDLQVKKLNLARAILTGERSSNSGSKLTLDDMKTLFGM